MKPVLSINQSENLRKKCPLQTVKPVPSLSQREKEFVRKRRTVNKRLKPMKKVPSIDRNEKGLCGRKKRLTNEQVWKLRAIYRNGDFTFQQLSKKFGISIGVVHHALNGLAAYKGV